MGNTYDDTGHLRPHTRDGLVTATATGTPGGRMLTDTQVIDLPGWPIRERQSVGALVVRTPKCDRVEVSVVNDEIVTDPHREVCPGDFVWVTTKDMVRSAESSEDLALRDLGGFSSFCYKAYGEALDIVPYWEDQFVVVANFPLPTYYERDSLPVLLPLKNFPYQPPQGFYLPTVHPDTDKVRRSFSILGAPVGVGMDGPCLLDSGWSWVCFKYRDYDTLVPSWDYDCDLVAGTDNLSTYLAFANAYLRNPK